MTARLHRIEALPGAGRYAVAFTRDDGSEQTAVVHLRDDDGVDVAESALPAGWTTADATFRATADAVRAVDAARRSSGAVAALRDVDGGWDVSLGNVVIGAEGPECTAHGPMAGDGARWTCAECGAAALLG